jgi:hypothetical protein
MEIKWTRLRRICGVIVKRDVEITLTTHLNNDVRGAVLDDRGTIEVLINGAKCKTEEEVLSVVAHEITHVITGSEHHDENFAKTYAATVKLVREMYSYGNHVEGENV